ncbi:conserved hypothetical protein [Taylorella asinigenitalis 14/45]|uniref:DUF465 domain-containing protein n=1 Tax=Taylorella asinigenitalis 14/45 TaxID=1091495 RepID=I7JLK6_9BURK|nr:YdcH family protein [Taylorella asinigenitalis]CCG19053.1 conserved hypothetical protein [Taylorella asinigenitalis 14/45]
MFPEYRDLISKLKNEDAHFTRLFDLHNELDHQVEALEANPITQGREEIDTLKKKKLQLKDQIYEYLRNVAQKD